MDLSRHYHRHRYPIEIVGRCVWLYFRYSLSYRDVEEMMFERRVTVSYETIRAWCRKFGAEYSKRLKKCRGTVGETWHLDEVYIKIDGRNQYLWRAVDQEGETIDILLQSHRDSRAAEHIKDKGANNRAENSHHPTRQRERRRNRFRSAGSAQRFLSGFSTINIPFRNYLHTLSAPNHRLAMTKCFVAWNQMCGSVA